MAGIENTVWQLLSFVRVCFNAAGVRGGCSGRGILVMRQLSLGSDSSILSFVILGKLFNFSESQLPPL